MLPSYHGRDAFNLPENTAKGDPTVSPSLIKNSAVPLASGRLRAGHRESTHRGNGERVRGPWYPILQTWVSPSHIWRILSGNGGAVRSQKEGERWHPVADTAEERQFCSPTE